jgi:CheY-like chemotaxis protein
MKASSENLLSIINDILDFSKIESGQIEISKSDFCIHELIRKVYDGNEFRAEDKGIKFIYNIDAKISKYQKGDPLRILQVLNNLVSNAIKFTAEGKVEMKLGLLCTDETGEVIRFTVNDTGKGISPENQQKIFNSFQQEDESITRNYGGTGLGLAISKQLVELMGGKLEVESTKDVGSQFFFVLHLEYGKSPVTESVVENKPARGQSLNGVSILVVEDNKFNQFVAQAILEKWGATVEICDDGEPAIERLRNESFDLILMDIQMPEMDGITATNIIRKELGLKTPILALTANVMVEIFELCDQAGMQGYVSKPIDEHNFYEKIVSALKPPDEPVRLVDISNLAKLFNHDKKMIGQMIRQFIEVIPLYVNDLKLAAEKQDIVAIEKHSHKIKGAIVAVATDIMRSQIIRINDIGKIGRDTPEKFVEQEELYKFINDFLRAFPELIKQLENEIRGYS